MSETSDLENQRPTRSAGPAAMRWASIVLAVLLMAVTAWVIIQKRIWVFKTIHHPLSATMRSMEREGLKVGAPTILDSIPGVSQVIRLDVEGHEITLLEFDLLDPNQWETLAGIHNSQSTILLGQRQTAVVSKPLAMVGHDQHPQKERLLKVFRAF